MTERPIPAVGAAIVDRGRLLLVKRAQDPNKGLWAIPGGKIHWGETMHVAVEREIREETGLDIEVGEAVWVGDIIGPSQPPEWHYCVIDFIAHTTGGVASAASDVDELGWFTLEEARALPLTPTMPSLLDALERFGSHLPPPTSHLPPPHA